MGRCRMGLAVGIEMGWECDTREQLTHLDDESLVVWRRLFCVVPLSMRVSEGVV